MEQEFIVLYYVKYMGHCVHITKNCIVLQSALDCFTYRVSGLGLESVAYLWGGQETQALPKMKTQLLKIVIFDIEYALKKVIDFLISLMV